MIFGEDEDVGNRPRPDYFLIFVALFSFTILGIAFHAIITERNARSACQFVNNYTEYRASYSSANNECVGVIDGKAHVFTLNNGSVVIKKKEIAIKYE